ncbi:44537_t:CDS:2, partial [Gigaspora margarita]
EDMNLKEKAAKFNDWCHDTDDWPIEETIPAKLLSATVPVLLPANPVPWWLPPLETP